MLDQQIESASNKLVQFLQDLTSNIQTFINNVSSNGTLGEVLQLRADYARQLGSLFDMLIQKLLDQFIDSRKLKVTFKQMETLNIDPIQIWQRIQLCIDQMNTLLQRKSAQEVPDLYDIVRQIRVINNYFYNLLLQVKNAEFLKVDHTRTLSRNMNNEIDHLAENLNRFATLHGDSRAPALDGSEQNTIGDTYLFQSASVQHGTHVDERTTKYSNNNNHLNETTSSLCQQPFLSTPQAESTTSPAMNTNYYPCKMTNMHQQPPGWTMMNNKRTTGVPTRPCYQSNQAGSVTNSFPQRYTGASECPQTVAYPLCGNKAMGCGFGGSDKAQTPPPLFFPTPVVYTPEMETLFSAGGIIYARKSGNTWIAENLGTLVETLKDIGQTIDMGDHCEILVRKTGELFVRRKKGRRKKILQQTLTKTPPRNTTPSRGNNAHDDVTAFQEESNLDESDDKSDNDQQSPSVFKKHSSASKHRSSRAGS